MKTTKTKKAAAPATGAFPLPVSVRASGTIHDANGEPLFVPFNRDPMGLRAAQFAAAAINSHDRVALLEKALQLHLDFLGSLPEGWLGRTCADIGILNQAYILSRQADMKIS